VEPSHLPDRLPNQNDRRALSRTVHRATAVPLLWSAEFIPSKLAPPLRTKLRGRTTMLSTKTSEIEFCAELKDASRKGLGNLAKAGASNVIHAKSIKTAPVRLVEGVICVHPELQAHTFPGQIE